MSETTTAIARTPTPTTQALDTTTPRETGTALVAMPEADPFAGIAAAAFTEQQTDVLLREVADDQLDILPTGEIYLSQIGYRRRLNEAFKPGGWALRPMSKPSAMGNTLIREYALYIEGRFVSAAYGEADYYASNARSSYATAAESLKSNALMRCCKDLGIASECWDRRFTEQFKKDHCVRVWRAKAKNAAGEYQWRRQDADPFPDEKQDDRRPRSTATSSTRDIKDGDDVVSGEVVALRVAKVNRVDGKTASGRAYTFFDVSFSDGRIARTFSTTVAELAEQLIKDPGEIEVVISPGKKGGFDLEELRRVNLREPGNESEADVMDSFGGPGSETVQNAGEEMPF